MYRAAWLRRGWHPPSPHKPGPPGERRVLKLCALQLCSSQIGSIQPGLVEAGILEHRVAQIEAAKIEFGQIDVGQMDPSPGDLRQNVVLDAADRLLDRQADTLSDLRRVVLDARGGDEGGQGLKVEVGTVGREERQQSRRPNDTLARLLRYEARQRLTERGG